MTSPVTARLNRLRRLLKERELDALIVLDRLNSRYLSGLKTSHSILWIDAQSATFITDGRYAEAVGEALPKDFTLKIQPLVDVTGWLKSTFKTHAYGKVGIETTMSLEQHATLKKWTHGAKLHLAGDVMTSLRRVKDAPEIASTRKAVKLADKTMAFVFENLLKVGAREADIARQLRHAMEEMGAVESRWRAAPRVAASVEVAPGTSLTASIGRWWQTPSFSWLAGDASNAALQPFRADQAVLGLQRLLRPDLKLQLEAYVKRYADYPARVFRPQSVFAPVGFEDVKADIPFGLEPLASSGRGRAYGVELFLQKKLSTVPVYGLLSVAAARSEFAGLDGIYRAGPFDQRLLATGLVGWRPSDRWELSSKLRVATGAPTTPFVLTGPAAGSLDFTRYNAGPRTPIFHALDLRIDRRYAWRSRQLVLYLDVQNAYARKNVSMYMYNERTRAVEPDASLGILPSIGVNLSF